MSTIPTRALFAAVALSALAAALASSANARIPEGTGPVHASPTVVQEEQATLASRMFFVDPVYASLDPAIRIAIVAHSHAAPLTRKARTGKLRQRHTTFPAGYRGLP